MGVNSNHIPHATLVSNGHSDSLGYIHDHGTPPTYGSLVGTSVSYDTAQGAASPPPSYDQVVNASTISSSNSNTNLTNLPVALTPYNSNDHQHSEHWNGSINGQIISDISSEIPAPRKSSNSSSATTVIPDIPSQFLELKEKSEFELEGYLSDPEAFQVSLHLYYCNIKLKLLKNIHFEICLGTTNVNKDCSKHDETKRSIKRFKL